MLSTFLNFKLWFYVQFVFIHIFCTHSIYKYYTFFGIEFKELFNSE